MTFVNSLMSQTFDFVLAPLASLPVIWSVTLVSLGTAMAILLVMRATADLQSLSALRRQLYGDLLEIRLFKDDLRAIWRAQASMCLHNMQYVGLLIVPALWTFVPLAFVIAQLQCYFAYTGVEVGKPVLVTATLKSADTLEGLALEPPGGTRLETDAIWFPSLRQVTWRVVADSRGDRVLRLHIDGVTYEKTFVVSPRLRRRSAERPAALLLDELRYPSEAPLPESAPLSSIRVDYPDRQIALFGTDVSGMEAYYALSVIFMFALSRPLGIA